MPMIYVGRWESGVLFFKLTLVMENYFNGFLSIFDLFVGDTVVVTLMTMGRFCVS